MLQPARRPQALTIALPASMTLDIPHLREKTARLGLVARALATFRVEQVIIYQDKPGLEIIREAGLAGKLLTYITTPQYLRKHLYKMDPDLQYTGTLPPLRAPNHPDRQDPSPGMIRDGIVIQSGPKSMIEAGFHKPVRVDKKLPVKQQTTIQLTRTRPELEGETIDPSRLTIYWGFRVARGHDTLAIIVRTRRFDMTISTSRKGADIREIMHDIGERWNQSKQPLVILGSPDQGVAEILAETGATMSEIDFNINTIPNQGVETVRTEEALWSSLSILNTLGDKENGP